MNISKILPLQLLKKHVKSATKLQAFWDTLVLSEKTTKLLATFDEYVKNVAFAA
jgi:hypothetical protein